MNTQDLVNNTVNSPPQGSTSPTQSASVADLPPPEQLTPEQRLAILLKFRAQAIAGVKLKPEETEYVISLLRSERSIAAASGAKTRTKAAAAPAASLDDF